MNKRMPKLGLAKETLRVLSDDRMAAAQGALSLIYPIVKPPVVIQPAPYLPPPPAGSLTSKASFDRPCDPGLYLDPKYLLC